MSIFKQLLILGLTVLALSAIAPYTTMADPFPTPAPAATFYSGYPPNLQATESPIEQPAYGIPQNDKKQVLPSYNQNPHGIMPFFYGIVSAVSAKHLQFKDGRNVDIDTTTDFQPQGIKIERGMIIAVRGFFEPGHAINHPTIHAYQIVIPNGDGKNH